MTKAAFLRTPPARHIPALLGVAACVVIAGCDKSPSKSEPAAAASSSAVAGSAASVSQPAIPITAPIQKESGYAWFTKTDINPAVRKLRVFENDKELGPGDSMHEDIRKKGNGAYSHWDAKDQGYLIYFSTSDNSDPNTNGRSYSLR